MRLRGLAFAVFLAGCPSEAEVVADPTPIPVSFDEARGIFSAIGDIPYTADEEVQLAAIIASHNDVANTGFLIHLGDIKNQSLGLCSESHYTTVADLLQPSTHPVFVIPGDNEWNDCGAPEEAWEYWSASFLAFDAQWTFEPVERQRDRTENFAFVHDSVLFIGINLPGGAIHDEDEWATRHAANADWIDGNLAMHGDSVAAAVLLGHANPSSSHEDFMQRLIPSVAAFEKPFLFLHADGHGWIEDQPWDAPNLYRIQIEAGGVPPLLVGYDPGYEPPFIYDRFLFEVPLP